MHCTCGVFPPPDREVYNKCAPRAACPDRLQTVKSFRSTHPAAVPKTFGDLSPTLWKSPAASPSARVFAEDYLSLGSNAHPELPRVAATYQPESLHKSSSCRLPVVTNTASRSHRGCPVVSCLLVFVLHACSCLYRNWQRGSKVQGALELVRH